MTTTKNEGTFLPPEAKPVVVSKGEKPIHDFLDWLRNGTDSDGQAIEILDEYISEGGIEMLSKRNRTGARAFLTDFIRYVNNR